MPADAGPLFEGIKVLSIAELTAQVRQLLEGCFAAVWVSGEISNLKHHANGHVYFSLKDAEAQIAAVIWRSSRDRLRFALKDGMAVIAHGRVSVYAPQGKYQLVVDQLQPRGVGALELAFQQLCDKLRRRGWFDAAHKKPLPRFPRRIALVTSLSGAALRDMLRIIPRRWPPAEIWVCPVLVQGAAAAEDIAGAIERLNRIGGVDVMIVGRGGGSLEDLWAFNEERVAEAIFHSRIPVISAVGHEVDVTIADGVADRRAATPSEAAEIVAPDRTELLERLESVRRGLTSLAERRLRAAVDHLDALALRRVFRVPLERLHDRAQRLDDAEERLLRAVGRTIERAGDRLGHAAARLGSLSPLNVLGRGYSLTRKLPATEILRSTDQLATGDLVVTRLAHGEFTSRVEAVSPGNDDS